jgi:hypothetical protein
VSAAAASETRDAQLAARPVPPASFGLTRPHASGATRDGRQIQGLVDVPVPARLATPTAPQILGQGGRELGLPLPHGFMAEHDAADGEHLGQVALYAFQVRLDAAAFGQAVRAHWGIENRDHHVRDRILRADNSRIQRRPGIFARLRSFALNILRAAGVGNVSETVYVNALSLDRLLTYGLPRSQN